ncbi:Myb DNA-bind 5 domain-containing protein, partial [Aphis craccivora]
MDKRKRNVDFSAAEEELLVELEKEECWRKISDEFNSQRVLVARSCAQLQLKYKNLKKVVRKKSASIRFEHLKTGGRKDLSQALNLREEKLKSIIQLSVD